MVARNYIQRHWTLAAILVLAAALAPSAWLAWSWRAMPHTGIYHDDAIYLVAGKSLAEGNGYRIASLPGQPHQTKYPPLYPALLAAVWKVAPDFPANLPWVMLATWLSLPLLVYLSLRLLGAAGFDETARLGLAAFIALCPVAVQFSVIAMSEIPFCALLVAALWRLERGHAGQAGVLAGLAFLTRGAALPLLVTAPAVFVWRRQFAQAGRFAAAMLPAVIGWQVWAALHRAPADPLTLFYTDYFGYYRQDVPLAALPELFVFNLNPAVKAIGELLIFDEDSGFGALTLARILTAAVISGCVRLMRSGRLVHYGWFGALYTVQFLFWNYPPTHRFFLPLLPLVVAGAYTEFCSLGGIIAAAWRKKTADRVVAVAMVAFLGFLGWQSVKYARFGLVELLPPVFAQRAQVLAVKREAHAALRASGVSPQAPVLSYMDPVEYLYTGHRGYSLRLPPSVLKRADKAEIGRYLAQLPRMMADRGVEHVVLSEADYQMDCPDLTLAAYRNLFRKSPDFEKVFERGGTAVYRARTLSSRAAP
ncbi:MAG: hypothetical protein IT162_05355 [Bryobacterales bacterium]|nr:hypothetical protein [Bryobacterales bacterium]